MVIILVCVCVYVCVCVFLHFISAIHIFVDEFSLDDNLYCSWLHIRPMNVFDQRPKALSFPIRVRLVALTLGGRVLLK